MAHHCGGRVVWLLGFAEYIRFIEFIEFVGFIELQRRRWRRSSGLKS